MAKELRPLDVSDRPDVLNLAQEVADTGVGRVLRTEQGELAVVMPLAKRQPRRPRGRSITKEDGLYRLIGVGRSGSESDASERKHDILARAYRPDD